MELISTLECDCVCFGKFRTQMEPFIDKVTDQWFTRLAYHVDDFKVFVIVPDADNRSQRLEVTKNLSASAYSRLYLAYVEHCKRE